MFAEDPPIVFASAELVTPGQVGGTAIGDNEYVGWRFETTIPLAVEQVGGHMYAIPDQPGEIFAALVRLESLTSTPAGLPFTESELVAKTTFHPNFPSDDFRTPLSATLIPGSYMLVFGTGLFDASGGVGFPTDQLDISPTSKSSYLLWGVPSSGEVPEWREGQLDHLRLVVAGQETSFTADFENDGDVDGDDLTIWNGAYGSTALGDADGDGDSDGRDFLLWQRQFTGTAGDVPSSTRVVPEPTGLSLLFSLSVVCFLLRPRREGGLLVIS